MLSSGSEWLLEGISTSMNFLSVSDSLLVSKPEKSMKSLIVHRSDPLPRRTWYSTSVSDVKSFKMIKWETRDGGTSWSYVTKKKSSRNPGMSFCYETFVYLFDKAYQLPKYMQIC